MSNLKEFYYVSSIKFEAFSGKPEDHRFSLLTYFARDGVTNEFISDFLNKRDKLYKNYYDETTNTVLNMETEVPISEIKKVLLLL